MSTRKYAVLGPLMGGFNSQAFMGCEELKDGSRRAAVMVFLPDEVVDKPEVFEQLLAETEVAARIDHPNVMSVFGLAKIDDGFARVVEYAAAESLSVILKTCAEKEVEFPAEVALKLVMDACMGVHYAHELGATESGTPLIHGAVRPGTILVGYAGTSKVTGYGAAILAEGLARSRGQHLNQADSYTAPEQLLGGRNAATAQTDVYALGAVLFQLVTGKVPAASDSAVFETILKQQLQSPDLEARVSKEVGGVIERAMKKRAVERFKSPLDMRMALMNEKHASDDEVAAFMEGLFGQDFPARIAREQLLTNFDTAAVVESEILAPVGGEPAPSTYRSSANLLEVISHISGETEVPKEVIEKRAPVPAVVEKTVIVDRRKPEPPVVHPPAPAAAPVQYRTPPWLLVVVGMLVMAAVVGAIVVMSDKEPATDVDALAEARAKALLAEEKAKAEEEKRKALEAKQLEEKKPPEDDIKVEATTTPKVTPKVVPKEGKIVIRSTPEMALTVDGKVVGSGTATVTVKNGTHVVRGKSKKYGLNAKRTVKVRGGKTSNVSFRFEKGQLEVDAPSGSTVYVDGRRIGKAPLSSSISLWEGSHTVVVKKAGADDYRHRVRIRPGLVGTLTVSFN